MPVPSEQFLSVFFLLGVLVVVAHALQRFNEPSFPNQDTLPHTVVPLRYLFLRRSYRKALFTYVTASLVLYALLVLPGSKIAPYFPMTGGKEFPAEGWALVVALLLVGLLPNSTMKWPNIVEEMIRRSVHQWFLVPDGIVRTIGVLEDAHYDPPHSLAKAFPVPQWVALREDLKLPAVSLQARWARATLLLASLRQMGAGDSHPLKRSAFEPFQEDLQAIKEKYRSLRELKAAAGEHRSDEQEENLANAVEALLKRMYAYISWGIRHQAKNEREVYGTLEELGFQIPRPGDLRLIDVVLPAVLLLAAFTLIFWLTAHWFGLGVRARDLSTSVNLALSAAVSASLMYGLVIYIALKSRSAQIEEKVWRHGSARCLASIAFKAGFVTCAIIVATTAPWELSETLQSVVAMVSLDGTAILGAQSVEPGMPAWHFLPARVLTAIPWFLAGATASVLIAFLVGGDLRQNDRASRLRDTATLAVGLGLAVALAQLCQSSLAEALGLQSYPPINLVPIIGAIGLSIGAVIGYVVPRTCRTNLVTPFDTRSRRVSTSLLRQAEASFGSKSAAENWVFAPHQELGGIAPAEAIRYRGHATGVLRLLESEAGATHIERDHLPIDVQSIPHITDTYEAPIIPAAAPSELDRTQA
jgi:Protein of unknown function (DUF2384)